MPPATRRSARLALTTVKSSSSSSSTDKPAPTNVAAKKTSPVRKVPDDCDVEAAAPLSTPATPASAVMKPPSTEMHPSKFHVTSQAPSDALELGFSDIKVPRRRDSTRGSGLDSTPSKIGGVSSLSAFTFRSKPPAMGWAKDSKAQELMQGLQSDVAKFKAELIAQKEADESSQPTTDGRNFAKPKGKAGRFSAAHIAEFKKMDSIEGHASAWRAQDGRFTPVKTVKSTPSTKTNQDVTPTPQKSTSRQIPTKTGHEDTPHDRSRFGLKRKQSAAQLENRPSPRKTQIPSLVRDEASTKEADELPAKRFKQKAEDDASTARPLLATSIPQPTSSVRKTRPVQRSGLSRLISPAKTSVVQTKPVASTFASSLGPRQEAVPELKKLGKPAVSEIPSLEPSSAHKPNIASPSPFQKAKSILRGQKSPFLESKSGVPQLAPSWDQALASPAGGKALHSLNTPQRKAAKHVTFTPELTRTVVDQESPTPLKPGLLGKARALLGLESKQSARPCNPSTLTNSDTGDIVYPDLSGLKHLLIEQEPEPEPEPEKEKEKEKTEVKKSEPSTPGSFSFRSDNTIKFGNTSSPSGFGARPGQASIRHVRGSIKPLPAMPGGFPEATSSHPNKENAEPSPPKMLIGALHGMSNKKRHRSSPADSDAAEVGDERANKKRKQENVTKRDLPVTPKPLGTTPASKMRSDRPLGRTPTSTLGRTPVRSLGRTPGRVPGRTPGTHTSATPAQKRTTFDMSRLNELARPKHREVTN